MLVHEVSSFVQFIFSVEWVHVLLNTLHYHTITLFTKCQRTVNMFVWFVTRLRLWRDLRGQRCCLCVGSCDLMASGHITIQDLDWGCMGYIHSIVLCVFGEIVWSRCMMSQWHHCITRMTSSVLFLLRSLSCTEDLGISTSMLELFKYRRSLNGDTNFQMFVFWGFFSNMIYWYYYYFHILMYSINAFDVNHSRLMNVV